jgi:hypothetical protein
MHKTEHNLDDSRAKKQFSRTWIILKSVMTTLSSHSLNKYVSKVDGLSSGAQLTQLITALLNDPEVYVFGEIVESEKVKSVLSSDSMLCYSLLACQFRWCFEAKLRSAGIVRLWKVLGLQRYSTVSTFLLSHRLAKEKDFPPLTELQLSKLRQLTLITMAQKKRVCAVSIHFESWTHC